MVRYGIVTWMAACAVTAGGSTAAFADKAVCGDSLSQSIPARAAAALGGRAFTEQIRELSADEREALIQQQLLAGNVPDFLRHLVPVHMHQLSVTGQSVEVVLCAAPDYLAIGSDDDFLLTPMRLGTALSIATAYGFTLPTARIADAVYAQASVQLVPQPLPAGDEMRSTDYYARHNNLIGAQRSALGARPGALSAGDKKDLVLTNRLWNHLDRVAIYGWHRADGAPIQTLSTVHGWHYADYSHGARLISTRVLVNGRSESIFDVLQDPRLAGVLSDDGVMVNLAGLIDRLIARAHLAVAAVLPEPHRPLP